MEAESCASRQTAILVSLELDTYDRRELLYLACEEGYEPVIVRHISSLSSDEKTEAFERACDNDRWSVVELLVDLVPSSIAEEQLLHSCRWGKINVVPILLDRVDDRTTLDYCLPNAVTSGNTDLLRLLLKSDKLDPRADRSMSLYVACDRNLPKMVRLLLDDGRPDFMNNLCLDLLKVRKNWRLLDVLLADHRVDERTRELYKSSQLLSNLTVIAVLCLLVWAMIESLL